MKGLVKSLLHRLFDRQSAISTVEPKPTSPTNATVTLPHASNNVAPLSAVDCERVLNYWLDTELFDLPECPLPNKIKTLLVTIVDMSIRYLLPT